MTLSQYRTFLLYYHNGKQGIQTYTPMKCSHSKIIYADARETKQKD